MADTKATTAAPKTTIGSALTKALQQKKTKEAVAATTSGNRDTRQPMTLERARALAPHLGLMENIARSFPLDAMSQETAEEVYNELRDTMRTQIKAQADILSVVLSKQAMKLHLQRIVGAYVASAIGAGTYYQSRVTAMRDMHSAVANDDRDEDREAPAGFMTNLSAPASSPPIPQPRHSPCSQSQTAQSQPTKTPPATSGSPTTALPRLSRSASRPPPHSQPSAADTPNAGAPQAPALREPTLRQGNEHPAAPREPRGRAPMVPGPLLPPRSADHD